MEEVKEGRGNIKPQLAQLNFKDRKPKGELQFMHPLQFLVGQAGGGFSEDR